MWNQAGLLLPLLLTCYTLSLSSSERVRRYAQNGVKWSVAEAIKKHNLVAIESLMHQDELVTDHKEAQKLQRVQDLSSRLRTSFRDLDTEESVTQLASISIMNKTFVESFSEPRNDVYSLGLKDKARSKITEKYKEYELETFTQSFKSRKSFQSYKGTNIIGIKPGRFRGTDKDEILLIGCHYDTVQTSPGIDDNASGLVALLEIARLLHLNQKSLNHTLLFVAFDLEEAGLLGSIAFVREYLIPTELVKHKAKFIGAYIIDMMLSYETAPNSQKLPSDIASGLPHVKNAIEADESRGNFIALWSRKGVDSSLYDKIAESWTKGGRSSEYKLLHFDAPLPEKKPSSRELRNLGTFTRSDHAAFWYHDNVNYQNTLNAVLLTDMGPWRGDGKKCYHNWCDDLSQLKKANLEFYKHTVDALYDVVANNPPQYKAPSRTPRKPPVMRRILDRVRGSFSRESLSRLTA